MKTLYIHAGLPKTGTTTLQNFLKSNRDLLLHKHGLYYPQDGTLSFYRNATQEDWINIRKEIDSIQGEFDIIFSNEGVSGLVCNAQFDFSLLQNIFCDYTIKIIIYVRRLDDFAKSLFNQQAKVCSLPSPTAYPQDLYNYLCTDQTKWLYPSQILRKCAEAVGMSNVIARIYDKNALLNGSIVDDFIQVMGKEISQQYEQKNHNQRLPDASLPYLSKSIMPESLPVALRREVVAQARSAFGFPSSTDVSGVVGAFSGQISQELDNLEALLPGYKNLYAKRPLDFSFPEAEPQNPESLFTSSLCHLVLRKLEEQHRMLLFIMAASPNLHQQKTALRQKAAALHGKPVWYWGAGDAYEVFKDCFTELVSPQGIILDLQYFYGRTEIDGIPLVTPDIAFRQGGAIVIFARARHRNAIIIRCKDYFTDTTECILEY